MSVVHLQMAGRAPVVEAHQGPSVALQALRLVADVWLRRLSGTLLVPGFETRPSRALPFVDGALADRMAFMYLNAALHRDELRFEEAPVVGRSDRAALVRLLMDRARTLARQEQGAAFTEGLSLKIDAGALAALGLHPASVAALAPFAGAALPCILLSRARDDGDLAVDLRCLSLLGFVRPNRPDVGIRVPLSTPLVSQPASVPGRARMRELGRTVELASIETFVDPSNGLQGVEVNAFAMERLGDEDEEIASLLQRARAHMRQSEWTAAHELLVIAHTQRFDHARVLAHLAVVTLFAPAEPNADAETRARRFAELAMTLDDSDPVVRRLAREVDRCARDLAAPSAGLDWLEPSDGLSVSIL